MKVVIAGATGFVGSALALRLRGEHEVVGLTRGSPHGRDPRIEWRSCDLFSLLQCERALAGADQAVYLVHSMVPGARLTQGGFPDVDLILADNFARAAAHAGVRQIVYLGGSVPDGPDLSPHLRSRLEVERTLASRGVPVTALRAGIIVGPGGSSFGMLLSLVRRLPLIPCPRWTRSLTQPVALDDVLELIGHCLERPSPSSRSFDIGSPEVFSYRELLERTARVLGLKRVFVGLPFIGAALCRRALPLVTGAPASLTAPLLESMRHPMVACRLDLQKEAGVPGIPFEEAVLRALALEAASPVVSPLRGDRRVGSRDVRSVQRIPLPPGRSARWVAERYARWLPILFRTLLKGERDADGDVRLWLRWPRLLLLEHTFDKTRSASPDRQVFYITGGLLAKPSSRSVGRPRLEFREVLGGSAVLAAIHDYRPTLPWWLYRITQAPLHLWVMGAFARHLCSHARREEIER